MSHEITNLHIIGSHFIFNIQNLKHIIELQEEINHLHFLDFDESNKSLAEVERLPL